MLASKWGDAKPFVLDGEDEKVLTVEKAKPRRESVAQFETEAFMGIQDEMLRRSVHCSFRVDGVLVCTVTHFHDGAEAVHHSLRVPHKHDPMRNRYTEVWRDEDRIEAARQEHAEEEEEDSGRD